MLEKGQIPVPNAQEREASSWLVVPGREVRFHIGPSGPGKTALFRILNLTTLIMNLHSVDLALA